MTTQIEMPKMTAAEIQTTVILGGGASLKTVLEPIRAAVAEIMGAAPVDVFVSNGKVVVLLEADRCESTAASWKAIYVAAKAVRAALPESLRVSKPARNTVDGGTFYIHRDSFSVSVA
jgi:hypothetical protein